MNGSSENFAIERKMIQCDHISQCTISVRNIVGTDKNQKMKRSDDRVDRQLVWCKWKVENGKVPKIMATKWLELIFRPKMNHFKCYGYTLLALFSTISLGLINEHKRYLNKLKHLTFPF